MKLIALCILTLAAVFSPIATSQNLPLERCKYLQERIDYYTKLRKRGGAASQMESWKQTRRKYENEFRDGDCYKYATSLR